MRDKFAFITARDHYQDPSNDLHGCVNDSARAYTALVNTYGYPPDNVRVLNDERATKFSILERLRWLVANANADLVFYNSSHGSSMRIRTKDGLSDYLDDVI